ncbi:MAG: glycosyltransferase family 4 protein [Candidatus Zixiibacteriota bacterium]|nr:MAG: glycosyltransferase family 4 protein [candidate division Zixibacteria bacterium]
MKPALADHISSSSVDEFLALKRRFRIAMVGQKGLPATYGGIEYHVENLSTRLAARGHDVTVFCRPHYSGSLDDNEFVDRSRAGDYLFRGVSLSLLRSLNTKHLDAISHAALSTSVAAANGFDIIHYHGIGPSLVNWIPALLGKRVVSTVHALDFRQEKWGRFARTCLRAGLKCSLLFPDRTICVSRNIESYVGPSDKTVYIPNGVSEPSPWGRRETEWVRRQGLTGGKYVLFVGRLIADKGCHLLIRAVQKLGRDLKLAVAGESWHTDRYVRKLKGMAGEETVFLGTVHGPRLSALYANCALFVLPSAIEGLPIVLMEAMKHRAPVVASDIPENLEVLRSDGTGSPAGIVFRSGDEDSLAAGLKAALDDPDTARRNVHNAYLHVVERYGWESIVRRTENIYRDIMRSDARAVNKV